jgi:DNA polymerase-3 subunit gamma/tau
MCGSCRAVAEGEDVDVIEIDAASNTGVDNIRELIANSNYRPARSRFKVYIIDEVHMLSTGAFNALLKTLEEPPPHVKFIFATTEVHKVPATILSRVQRFDFRAIGVEEIAGQLTAILKEEGVTAHERVIRRVARRANGSMRDALSLLDQLLSLGESDLSEELVEEILPATHDEVLADLIDALAGGATVAALKELDRALSGGYTLERFCDTLIDQLRTLMLMRVCGAQSELVEVPVVVRDRVAAQAARFEPQQYVYMIALLEELRRQVRFSGAGRALADAAMVRLCATGRFSTIESLLAQLGGETTKSGRLPARAAGPAMSRDAAPAAVAEKKTPDSSVRASSASEIGRAETRREVTSEKRGVTSAELSAVRSDPVVAYALESFDGVVSNVERTAAEKPALPQPDGGDELFES